jgi:GDPmannose 4,6-dehydratase
MSLTWRGHGLEEKAYESGRCIVAVDARYFRPTDVETLLGDASKARNKLGWVPRTSFEELVREMTQADLRWAQEEQLLRDNRK